MKDTNHTHIKLGQWFATAICGNDILSSALYVSGIAALFAGVFAPIILVVIAGVLFCYKAVYTEVVEALPVNGGAYNCLLNATSKTVAAIAGVTTLLSYVATAVISATIAVEYVHTVLPIPIIPSVVILLGIFALLVISGLKDSAKVAFGIFLLHIAALSSFVLIGLLFYLKGGTFFVENIQHTFTDIINNNGLVKSLFLAFSASLLGVSGFESSANFVEEQQPGVFRKTLRNMMVGVAIFNPLVALVALNSAPLSVIANAKEFLLAREALIIGGNVFQYFIVADAFLVLSGAVLTSYIGVSGLVYRMAADACLPEFLTAKNSKGSYWKIILTFFVLCTSILLLTRGSLLSLAGVYTIAFLTVMSLFAFGNLLLRVNRPTLKKSYIAPITLVIVAFSATALGIIGNILVDPMNLVYFLLYFIPALLLVLSVVYEDFSLRILLKITKRHFGGLHRLILIRFHDAIDGTIIVFIRNTNRLYKILNYIHLNEKVRHIILVHCGDLDNDDERDLHDELKTSLPVLEKAGVFPHLNIEFHHEDRTFGPELIESMSRKYRVHKNRIFIGSIHHSHQFDYSDLGGVRIIF